MSESTNKRFEAFSKEWVDALREYVSSKISSNDLVGVKGSISMELTNPPKHLLRYGLDRVAWSVKVQDGKLEILDRPLPDADCRSVADYSFVAPALHLSNEEDRKWVMENRSALNIVGDPRPLQPIFIRLNLREGFYNVYTA